MESSAGALSDERREQLEEIDASWCPSWPVTWQRTFYLVRMDLDAGQALPTEAGDVVRQGEDLGRWVQSVRYGFTTVQQWMCEQILGIEPAPEEEKPQRPRTQADSGTPTSVPPGSSSSARGTLRSRVSTWRPCPPRTAGRTSTGWGRG